MGSGGGQLHQHESRNVGADSLSSIVSDRGIAVAPLHRSTSYLTYYFTKLSSADQHQHIGASAKRIQREPACFSNVNQRSAAARTGLGVFLIHAFLEERISRHQRAFGMVLRLKCDVALVVRRANDLTDHFREAAPPGSRHGRSCGM